MATIICCCKLGEIKCLINTHIRTVMSKQSKLLKPITKAMALKGEKVHFKFCNNSALQCQNKISLDCIEEIEASHDDSKNDGNCTAADECYDCSKLSSQTFEAVNNYASVISQNDDMIILPIGVTLSEGGYIADNMSSYFGNKSFQKNKNCEEETTAPLHETVRVRGDSSDDLEDNDEETNRSRVVDRNLYSGIASISIERDPHSSTLPSSIGPSGGIPGYFTIPSSSDPTHEMLNVRSIEMIDEKEDEEPPPHKVTEEEATVRHSHESSTTIELTPSSNLQQITVVNHHCNNDYQDEKVENKMDISMV